MESIADDEESGPRLGVSAAVWNDGRVLLVKRRRPPLLGTWSFPGGRVRRGERLAVAALRELHEETAVAAEILRQIDTVEIILRDRVGAVSAHHVLAVFSARYLSGIPTPGDDAEEAAWVSPTDAVHLPLAPDTRRLIAAGPPQP